MAQPIRSLVLAALVPFLFLACDDGEESSPWTDDDGDGFSEAQGDCNDEDPEINPHADELCDMVDNNCDDAVDNYPYGLLHLSCTLPCGSEGEAHCVNGEPGQCTMSDNVDYPDECYDWH